MIITLPEKMSREKVDILKVSCMVEWLLSFTTCPRVTQSLLY